MGLLKNRGMGYIVSMGYKSNSQNAPSHPQIGYIVRYLQNRGVGLFVSAGLLEEN